MTGLKPESPDDGLIVAGAVGELTADSEWALALLPERFARLIWAPRAITNCGPSHSS